MDRGKAGRRAPRHADRGTAMSGACVLLVDDDLALLQALPEALRLRMGGVKIDTADSAEAALDLIAARDYDAIVTDIKMPGIDGLELLAEIRTQRPDTPTVMITGHGEHDLVVQALRGGAYDFIQKPIDRDHLVASLSRAIQMRELSRRVKEQQAALERNLNDLEAIVEGETGTGKELVARAIHQLSARRDKPFVAVDCGAIPDTLIESELFGYEKGAFTGAHKRKEGQFQRAEGGSLFLDEIVNLPLPTQAKLLRALQERQVQPLGSKQPVRVSVRIIAAANVSLEREVRAGRFRQDVYYRLNEFAIALPPLRERDDILHLANEFLPEASMELGRPCRKISEAAAQVLLRYHWPGNVRELSNVIRRAILLASDVIEPEHLSVLPGEPSPASALRAEPAPGDSSPGDFSLKGIAEAAASDAERRAIHQVLQATRGNKSEAARQLRTDYKTLHLKMKQYGIDSGQFKEFSA